MPYELPSCECVMGQSPSLADLLKNIYCAIYAGGAGGGLPDQAGHAGEFLTTNGTNASWVALPGGGNVSAGGALTLNSLVIGQGGAAVAVTSTAAGALTFLGTPSSANLRSMMTDESGTGALLFANGAIGTPVSGTLTNCTGLPIGGVTGLGTGVATALAINVGTAGAPVVLNGAGGTPSAIALANGTGLPLTTGVTGDLPLANLAQASAASRLLGRGSAGGAGDYQEITLGSGLTMTGTSLAASGGAGAALTATQVGFGDGSNLLSGSANFTWIVASGALSLDNGAGLAILSLGSGGVSLSGDNGTFIIQGQGGGQAEDLVFDFDSTANTVEVTSTTGVTLIDFGTIGLETSAATITTVDVTTTFRPATNDTVSIGDATHQWTDLFLSEGAVINFDNGDATITQTANDITFGGISTLTLGAATALTAGTGTFAATTSLLLGTAGSAVGNVGFRNATSGTITLAPTTGALGTVTQTLQAVTGTVLCTGGTDVPVADGGTGLSSGTSGGILGFTASGTLASSTALASGALVIGGGAGATPTSTTTGANVVTALGVAVGSAGAIVVNGGVLGTPSSGTATNLTGIPPAGIVAGVLGGTITLGEGTQQIALDPALSSDGTYSGIIVTGTSGYAQTIGDLVYLDPTDSRWEAADANSASGADGDARGNLAMVVVAGTDGNSCTLLLRGRARFASFPAGMTVNNPIYVSETAGGITQTQPTTTDVVIRIIGHATTGDEINFCPDNMWITHT